MKLFRVLAYRETGNLGDAIQTYALARLLPSPLVGVFRDNVPPTPSDSIVIVNGWLGDRPPEDRRCLFAGVHLGLHRDEQASWIARSPFRIGARDPFTQEYLAQKGILSEMIGCATMTLPRYDGPRSGVWNVDVPEWAFPGVKSLSNSILPELSWPNQWADAVRRLDLLRTAERVNTLRLHVAIPCLAFGTPVVFPKLAIPYLFEPERISLLDAIGFEYDVPFTMDLNVLANCYRGFLSQELGIPITDLNSPEMPPPLWSDPMTPSSS